MRRPSSIPPFDRPIRATARPRWIALLLALALVGWASAAAGVGAQAPAAADACAAAPPGSQKAPESTTFDSRSQGGGIVLICYVTYGPQATTPAEPGSLLTIQLVEAGFAQQMRNDIAEQMRRALDPRVRPIVASSFGEAGYEEEVILSFSDTARGLRGAKIAFVRGCYGIEILTGTGGDFEPAMAGARKLAAEVDGRLKQRPPCPTAATTSSPLKAGIACERDRLDQSGEAICAASLTGQRADAQITFEWTVDGKGQSERGNTLRLTGLVPGSHSVSVRARDTKNNLTSNPETVSLSRGGTGGAAASPGAGTPGGQSGGSGVNLPPLIAGGAAAVAAAIALVQRALRGQSRRPGAAGPTAATSATSPPPTTRPEPPASAPAPPPPNSRPEQTREDNRPRSPQPQVQVELLLEPSVRMQTLGRQGESRIWGDEADFCYAGYRITLLTPDWVRTAQPVQATLEGDGPQFVTGGALAESPGAAGLEAGRCWKVRAQWSDVTRPLPLHLSVTAEFRHVESGDVLPAQARDDAKLLTVAGARPRLELQAVAPADADGSDWALIRPYLVAFGEPYTGGLELSACEPTPESDRYFFNPMVPEFAEPPPGHHFYRDPATRRTLQGVPVRCRFHLDDDAMKEIAQAGAPIRLWVRPTGQGYGQDLIAGEADEVVAAHYRSCAEHLNLRREPGNVSVPLRPSRIVCESPNPPGLPCAGASQDEMYRTRLRLRVVSASGNAVKREAIRAETAGGAAGPPVTDWSLKVFYDPPANEPLRSWDPGKEASQRTYTREVVDVDDSGYLTFEPAKGQPAEPWLDYDHWKEFWGKHDRYQGMYAEPETGRYLPGQCCTLRLSVRTLSAEFDVLDGASKRAGIFIGPPCKLYLYVDSAYDRDSGMPIDIVAHPFIGLIDERGQELRVGFYPYRSIHGVLPYQAGQYAGAAVGTVGGAVAGGYIAGPAALAVLAKLGLAVTGAATGLVTIPIALGVALTGAAVGGLLGTFGVGRLRDEGNTFDGHSPHGWDYCRAWDISRSEYDRILARLREWKRQSDIGGLGYDITGGSVIEFGPFTGNCATFTVDVCETVGIKVPFARGWDMRRPGNIADGLKADPRCEVNQNPNDGVSHIHQWQYEPDTPPRVRARLGIDATLGVVQPPPPPTLPPESSPAMPQAGPSQPPQPYQPPPSRPGRPVQPRE